MKLGAARKVQVEQQNPYFTFRLGLDKLKQPRHCEGRYLRRTNLTGCDPTELRRY